MLQAVAQLQSDFIRTLGKGLMPWLEMGFGNPLFGPIGAIVVEVADKETGRKYKLPLTATRLGNWFLLTAIRPDASWLQNLMATPDVRYWFAGRPHNANALVVTPNAELPPNGRAKYLLQWLRQQSRLTGWSFTVLVPRD